MRKSVFMFFLIIFLAFFASCGELDKYIEKYNIGDIPPEVEHVSVLPAGYTVPSIEMPPKTFDAFEKEVKESFMENVILECEMVEGGTLIKSFKDNNKSNLGNYCSFVLTPVRVLKIYFQNDKCEVKFKEGDVIYVKENYFWVTSDMEEVLVQYSKGTYLTCSHYYPMMMGERYIVYATPGELNDYGVNCEKTVLYPHRGSAVYCISEDSIHIQRQKTYDWYDEIYQAGAWLKYSGKSEFQYEYADVFTEIEENMTQVHHVDKTPFTLYKTFEEKKATIKDDDNGRGVILKVDVMEKGNQIPVSNIDELSDYDFCTTSTVKIKDVLYVGDEITDTIELGDVLKVYEPYYMKDGKYITHSRYIPLDIAKSTMDYHTFESILFAYVYEIDGKTILIPACQASAVSLNSLQYAEHIQITLGPEGYLSYLETYAAGQSIYTDW